MTPGTKRSGIGALGGLPEFATSLLVELGRGIRTPGSVARTLAYQASALNHSATPPRLKYTPCYEARLNRGAVSSFPSNK